MFYRERIIKSVRKARWCGGCIRTINVGETALDCSGVGDDGFGSATYHQDCRRAEIALNTRMETGFDEWCNLSDIDSEDVPWLRAEFPSVAERMFGKGESDD